MTYSFLAEFTGSPLFPSRQWIEREDFHSLAEKAYLLILTLRVLLCIPSSRKWAEGYLRRSFPTSHFRDWRSGATDLYVVLWALTTGQYEAERGVPDRVAESPFVYWMRAIKSKPCETVETKRLFLKLDTILHNRDSSMKSIRRLVQDWPQIDHFDRQLATTRLLQMLRSRAPRAECLRHLSDVARKHDYELSDVHNPETGEDHTGAAPDLIDIRKKKEPKKAGTAYGFLAGLAGLVGGYSAARALGGVKENATPGATAASSVATVVGGLGVGFDPNGHERSIYPAPKKEKKPKIIRRVDPD